jgi:hypothetical protein
MWQQRWEFCLEERRHMEFNGEKLAGVTKKYFKNKIK